MEASVISRMVFKKLNKIYDRLLMIAFVLLFLIVVYSLVDMYIIFDRATNNDYLNYKPTPESGVPEDAPITEDMVAWITLDDTMIDYPVMQGKDNMEYLNIDPFGEYSLSGSIFLDSRSNPKFADPYSIIYGHHMEYGKMFGALDDYLDESFLKEHSKGTLIVGRNSDKVYTLKVFAALHVNAKVEQIFEFDDATATADYIEKNADVYTERLDKRIIGLATCTTVEPEERTVVFCYVMEDD